jgi:hypothetical protein
MRTNLSRRLKEKSSFETGEHCRGIAYRDERLFVACGGNDEIEGPGHMKIFNIEGKVLKQIYNDSYRIIDFNSPRKIIFLPDGNTAVVTDSNKLIQIELDFSEDKTVNIKKIGTISMKSWNESLCFDSDGHIVITDNSAHSVTLMSKDFTRYEPIVSDLQHMPNSVLLDNQSLKLFVGLVQSTDLLCFQLELMKWEKPTTF